MPARRPFDERAVVAEANLDGMEADAVAVACPLSELLGDPLETGREHALNPSTFQPTALDMEMTEDQRRGLPAGRVRLAQFLHLVRKAVRHAAAAV